MSYVLALVRRHTVATLAIVLALSGTAFAAGGGVTALTGRHSATTQIYACVTNRYGTLNLTTAQARCPHGERKISWGAVGPRGLRGATGADGATGAHGAAGPQGAKGDKGATGDTGSQGPIGLQGLAGADGPQGPMGDKGPPGATGSEGPIGVQGLTGADGLQGPKGDKGAPGDTGSEGPIGVQGLTGAEGPQGPKGDTGAIGPQGPIGPKGDTGATGPQGPSANFLGNNDSASSAQRATSSDATVAGGADIPFSGPTSTGSGITHVTAATGFTIADAGRYRITATVNTTSGAGAAIAVAVNGTVRAASNVSILATAGQTVSDCMLPLAAGDVLTVRNNSSTPFTTDLFPGVGASLVIERIG